MKKIILAGALAAAIVPLTALSAGATTSLPAGPAIYPGDGKALTHVTSSAPAEVYTPWGVITDEYGTGETVPVQYGGSQNGKAFPYPGWTTSTTPHVQLNFAVLTTPSGGQTVIQNVVNGEGSWASAGGGAEYPTCLVFTVAATGGTYYMGWSKGAWVNAPGCVIPG